jgi:predicted dehydrogenase
MRPTSLKIGVIGADHVHVFGMLQGMLAEGAVCKGYWTGSEPDALDQVTLNFGDIPRVEDRRALLDDPEIALVLVAAEPSARARLSIEAMRYGKDVMSDKPGCLTLEDLAELRRAADETGRIWSVNFSERCQVRAMAKAADLVSRGEIGDVVQTVGLGPHRLNRHLRKSWFFDPSRQGGILADIGSHQIDHFLFFTGSTSASVVASSVGNFNNTDLPRFQDWGEVLLRGNHGVGYSRVDWLTPDSADNWGDSRLVIQGTQGTLEVRKYVDVGGRPGPDHLFIVKDGRSERVECSNAHLTYFRDLAEDVEARSDKAMRRGHALLATELAIKAQMQAKAISLPRAPESG